MRDPRERLQRFQQCIVPTLDGQGFLGRSGPFRKISIHSEEICARILVHHVLTLNSYAFVISAAKIGLYNEDP
jgi:hypothetical protein